MVVHQVIPCLLIVAKEEKAVEVEPRNIKGKRIIKVIGKIQRKNSVLDLETRTYKKELSKLGEGCS